MSIPTLGPGRAVRLQVFLLLLMVAPLSAQGDLANEVIFGKSEPDICWKDTYGRGVGTVPDRCAPGRERIGLLCYSRCPSGMKRFGFDCHTVCPAGMRNDGLFCRRAEYGRGVGYPWKLGDTLLSLDDARRRCRRENPQGCEKYGEIIYPKCKAGYRPFGCCICRPRAPDCRALGMNPGIDLSCAKKVIIGDPVPGICAPGEELDAGLCYPECRGNADGVGPVCWDSCPSDYPVNCGAACGVSSAACGFAIFDQVASTAEVALNVTALVATAGTANTALRAAQVAGRNARRGLSKVAREQLKDQAVDQIRDARRYQKVRGRADQGGDYLGKAENVDQAAELLVKAYEEGDFDFTSLQPSMADFEPTGMLALVNSFNKPICGDSTPTPRQSRPTRRPATVTPNPRPQPRGAGPARPTYVTIMTSHTRECLQATNSGGLTLKAQPCSGRVDQQFELRVVSRSHQPDGSFVDAYQLVARSTGRCLQGLTGFREGSLIGQATCGGQYQRFALRPSGLFNEIVPMYVDGCLEVAKPHRVMGGSLSIESCEERGSQRFAILAQP